MWRVHQDTASYTLTYKNKIYRVVISKEDLRLVGRAKLSLMKEKDILYVEMLKVGGKMSDKVLLHRFLTNAPSDMFVDHRDGDTLNNTRTNLRMATRSQNNANRAGKADKELPKGVFLTDSGKYRARIMVEGKNISLGTFSTVEEAVLEYNEAAVYHYGEFARINEEKK